MMEQCALCGEAIPDGEAEFDLSGGRLGLPHHPVCLSMPTSLKAKLAICPACNHMKGRHMEVTAINLQTGKGRSLCTCGVFLRLRLVHAHQG